MKKITLLFTLAFSLILASCSSDDGMSSSTSGDLLGTWVGVDVDYSGTTVTEAAGQNITADFVGEAYDVDYTLTFGENPNTMVADGSYSIELTTTFAGQTQVDNVENIEFLSDGTWSRVGDELTITSQGEDSVATITELTNTTLKLSITVEEDVSEQGFTITTMAESIVTFTRQ